MFTQISNNAIEPLLPVFGSIATKKRPLLRPLKCSKVTFLSLKNTPLNTHLTEKNSLKLNGLTSDIKFGIDADGNYGYIKDGADTVTPFLSGVGKVIKTYAGSTASFTYTFTATDVKTYKLFICIIASANDTGASGNNTITPKLASGTSQVLANSEYCTNNYGRNWFSLAILKGVKTNDTVYMGGNYANNLKIVGIY